MTHLSSIARSSVMLLIALLSICPLRAEQCTITIDSYNAASLTGDCEGLSVSFYNEQASKGQVTAGKTATLTLTGLPEGQLTRIALWVKSNKNSGAAQIQVVLNNQTLCWQLNGTLAEWAGAYSTDYIQLAHEGVWPLTTGSSLQVTMQGITNSITLSHCDITFTAAPPQPYCVTFYESPYAQQTQPLVLCEEHPYAGILLPEPEPINIITDEQSTSWYGIGWVTQPQALSDIKPDYYAAGKQFYPMVPQTLYALYCNQSPQAILPSWGVDGEYALVNMERQQPAWILGGAWNNRRLGGAEIYLSGHELVLDSLDATYRYQLEFKPDSVAIYHPRSDQWIGHTASGPSKRKYFWVAREANDGSHYIGVQNQQDLGYALTLMLDDQTGNFYIAYMQLQFDPTECFWLAYPLDQLLPTSARRYGSWITDTALPPSVSCGDKGDYSSPRKILYNGHLYIELPSQRYNILGMPR